MRIAVLGTGMAGQTLAGRLAELGHEVVIGTRDPAATMSRAEPDMMGRPPFPTWAGQHPDITLAPFADAVVGADLVLNATNGAVSLQALQAAGADNLAGKVLVDIANPLDFSKGFPPSLFVKDTDSLAEQIQRDFPATKVVKALNTMNASIMANPKQLAGGDHSVFVCGNDAEAKAVATDLLRGFGWTDIIDLGDLTAARGAEMVLPIWVRLMGVMGTPTFNFKIVR
jgi:8-hydroxy-5-deazaflavin:NADPH oxidoreductase